MEYESTILKRLIDTYGVVGNPRYLSEIIKEFIVRGKELYPQLFTYQSDWLAHIDEFGLTPDYVVSYTGQQIYAPHTKERPVKSAILKGQTLVNIVDGEKSAIADHIKEFFTPMVKVNTDYLIIYNAISNSGLATSLSVGFLTGSETPKWSSANENAPLKGSIVVNSGSEPYCLRLNGKISGSKLTVNNVMVIEYQAGMENWDIDYFEGMQSVKMPVLTTSNEDGTKTNILTVNEDVTLRGIGDVQDTLDCLSGEVTERIGEWVFNGTQSIAKIEDLGEYTNIRFTVNGVKEGSQFSANNIYCDILPVVNNLESEYEQECVKLYGQESYMEIRMTLSKTKVGISANSVNAYLQANPITVQYQLATESIKTVVLSVKDQDNQVINQLSTFEGGTHFSTSSQDGSLQPTIIVDVVTDLEETLSLCSMDGNTL